MRQRRGESSEDYRKRAAEYYRLYYRRNREAGPRALMTAEPREQVPASVLAERDRALSEPRALTSIICGDPVRSRSALGRLAMDEIETAEGRSGYPPMR
jgi:hypothetical protein